MKKGGPTKVERKFCLSGDAWGANTGGPRRNYVG